MRVIFQQGQPRMAEGDEFKEGGEIIIQRGGMKEDSFCRATHFRGTAGARRAPLLASPSQGGDQHRMCSAPTYGSWCKKVISACSRMLPTVGTITPARLPSAHTQAPSSPCLPQEMPRLWAASALHLQHQPPRAERSISATTVRSQQKFPTLGHTCLSHHSTRTSQL